MSTAGSPRQPVPLGISAGDGTAPVAEGKRLMTSSSGAHHHMVESPRPMAASSLHHGGELSSEQAAALIFDDAFSQTPLLWEFQTGDHISSSPCIGPDGTVYVGSEDNKLYAVKDGKKVWEFEAGGGLESSPCISPDGTIYVGCWDRKLYAVKDGMKVWEYETGSGIKSSPSMGSDGTIYIGSQDGKLYALVSPEVKLARMYEKAGEPSENAPSDVIDDEEWLIIDGVKLEKQ